MRSQWDEGYSRAREQWQSLLAPSQRKTWGQDGYVKVGGRRLTWYIAADMAVNLFYRSRHDTAEPLSRGCAVLSDDHDAPLYDLWITQLMTIKTREDELVRTMRAI